MTILFVVEHYYPYIGGAEKLFQELAEGLTEQGHEVIVVTTHFDPNLPAQEQHKGVFIHRVRCYNRFLFTLFSLPAVLRYAKKADIVHTTTYNAALPAWMGAKWHKKPTMITFHELWGKLWFELPFLSWFQRRVFYMYEQMVARLDFDRFIAVSKFTAKALREQGINEKQICQIYNGMDYQRFAPYHHRPPSRFTYTYFGRLGVSKGLDMLLPAAQAFTQIHPDSLLKLIIPKTPPDMFKRIITTLQQLEIEDNVLLLHELDRDTLYKEISSSSCVVIPSYSEGFGFVAAESVALGVPVISSQQGALQEVVCGKFIPMRQQNSESLTQALIQAHRQQWQKTPVRYFELQESVDEYIRLYQQYEKNYVDKKTP